MSGNPAGSAEWRRTHQCGDCADKACKGPPGTTDPKSAADIRCFKPKRSKAVDAMHKDSTDDCVRCEAVVACCTHGASTVECLRAQIQKLRDVLAVVVRCEKRKLWDSSSGTRSHPRTPRSKHA